MTDRLMLAFAENEAWLSDFSRRGYEDGFRRYCGQFLPDYLAAVREKGAEGIPTLADGLLDAMEAQWSGPGSGTAVWPEPTSSGCLRCT